MPLDVDRFASAMLEGVQALIAKATAPLVAEIDAVKAANAVLLKRVETAEAREFPAFDPSPIEARVKSLSDALEARPEPKLPDVSGMVQEAVSAAVAGMGESAEARALEAVKAAVEALPAPRDWSEDIEAVLKAVADMPELPELPELPDLSGFVTREEVKALIPEVPTQKDWTDEIEAVRKAIPELPPAIDVTGFATKDAVEALAKSIPVIPEARDWSQDIRSAVEAIKMPEVIHGKDGVGLADARQNEDGELILKLTTGDTINVGKVRGGDGLGFDDMTVEDGEREFAIVFARGEQTKRYALMKPILKDCGVWREGDFRKGDGVTWAGSFWIAQRDTSDKPETSDAWRLAVKRGQNGKDLRPREPQGPVKR